MKNTVKLIEILALTLLTGFLITSCEDGSSADSITSGLEFTKIDSGYSVSKGTATDANVIIPSVYNGEPVTQIAPALYNPATGLFEGGFANYTNMTSIYIPGSVTSIGNDWTFDNCSSLTDISAGSSNPVYRSEGNCLIKKANNVLVLGCKNSVIPGSVTGIGNSAFSGCTGLTDISIPASVTNIDNFAFDGCSNLAGVTLGTAKFSPNSFPGNLYNVYFTVNKGAGTYVRTLPSGGWTKQ